jgi:hypothetical protein
MLPPKNLSSPAREKKKNSRTRRLSNTILSRPLHLSGSIKKAVPQVQIESCHPTGQQHLRNPRNHREKEKSSAAGADFIQLYPLFSWRTSWSN